MLRTPLLVVGVIKKNVNYSLKDLLQQRIYIRLFIVGKYNEIKLMRIGVGFIRHGLTLIVAHKVPAYSYLPEDSIFNLVNAHPKLFSLGGKFL